MEMSDEQRLLGTTDLVISRLIDTNDSMSLYVYDIEALEYTENS